MNIIGLGSIIFFLIAGSFLFVMILDVYLKSKIFINNFRLVKYDKDTFAIQQQNKLGQWLFIRNVSSIGGVLHKKYIIHSLKMNDSNFLYNLETAKEILDILSTHWDNAGVYITTEQLRELSDRNFINSKL